MSNYSFVAIDSDGRETRGTLEVGDQGEALRRIKEMGLFPTKILAQRRPKPPPTLPVPQDGRVSLLHRGLRFPFARRVKPTALTVFTRQLSTLVEAGMPLLRGLRILHEQEVNPILREVICEVATAVESGSSFSEALSMHPKVFNRLYVNMVKAGEIGGALEVTLRRLAEFMEKSQRIKHKVKAAMAYPCAVLLVATGIVLLLMLFVLPRFQQVFNGLLEGERMPAFTLMFLHISEFICRHFLVACAMLVGLGVTFGLALRTVWGRWVFDKVKLTMPALGPVFRKAAISRFARTLGTLVSSGVPILQALTIVKETAGNVVVGRVIGDLHDRVKEGDCLAPTLKASSVFPVIVAGMVDVGEQTGALPEMLIKVADNYDEEVDNAASAMTALLEPIMIVFLAVVVGSIVLAMFLPILRIIDGGIMPRGGDDGPGGRV